MCSFCAFHIRKAGDNAEPVIPDHKCHLNWAGSSPAMEADIISKVGKFLSLVKDTPSCKAFFKELAKTNRECYCGCPDNQCDDRSHHLQVQKVIADGDASTYALIVHSLKYSCRKLECSNHVCRVGNPTYIFLDLKRGRLNRKVGARMGILGINSPGCSLSPEYKLQYIRHNGKI